MTILMIDDDPLIHELLAEYLKLRAPKFAGVAAYANSASQGIGLLGAADAAVCDGLNGDWVKVWAVATKRGVRFALFSGDEREIVRAAALGVQTFSKPGSTDAVIAWLLSPIENRKSKIENGDPSTQPPAPSPDSLDDPRFVNGRRTGCISPNQEQVSGVRYQVSGDNSAKSASSADLALDDATGHPYGPTEGE